MTNTIALWLGALIVGFFLLDALVLGSGAYIFLMRKLLDLINYLAIWR